jgi:hypothetical protein
VAQTQERVLPQHAGAGVTHDGFDLVAAAALIAVDRTLGAGGFFGAETTSLQPDCGVVKKSVTFLAQTGHGRMFVPAMEADHRFHGVPFAGQAGTRGSK